MKPVFFAMEAHSAAFRTKDSEFKVHKRFSPLIMGWNIIGTFQLVNEDEQRVCKATKLNISFSAL